ncbi:protein LEG1 homolog [Ambystoma mexicanum]|uniref:protein LEG1 homolog n=1 Tax=Ambystoma mexicanum TaxID=8296 RepID=UPI0037E93C13
MVWQPVATDVLKLALCTALIHMSSAEAAGPASANGYPLHWDECPAEIAEFPKQDNQTIINPWLYTHRMGLYKILIKHTAKYFEILGLNNTGNLLWGLTLQHGWQFQTGRLADPSKFTTCGHENGNPLCASVYSWWACMNYDFSVVPFLAAAEVGIIDNWQDKMQLQPPEQFIDDFCNSITSCHASRPEAMEKWVHFFKILKKTQPEPAEHVSSAEEELLQYLWSAHEASLKSSPARFENRLLFLTRPEEQFALDWAMAVNFITATHFHSDFETTHTFQTVLAPRMLTAEDHAPRISDFSKGQNRVLSNLRRLKNMNKSTGGFLLKMWNKAMCTKRGREEGRHFLLKMTTSSNIPFTEVFRIITALVQDPLCKIQP